VGKGGWDGGLLLVSVIGPDGDFEVIDLKMHNLKSFFFEFVFENFEMVS
jgi:hypothetical protein